MWKSSKSQSHGRAWSVCKSNFGKRSHHTIFHIWLMFGPFGLFWRCVGFYLIDLAFQFLWGQVYAFGRCISFRGGAWSVCKSNFWFAEAVGAGWAGVGTILRLSWSMFGRVSTILGVFSGICCFNFGLGHFLVVEVWFRWLGFWSWAFQGCWVLALFVFTLDLGHFSVVKFWVLAQRCQRKQYIHTKNCNSLLAALLMF